MAGKRKAKFRVGQVVKVCWSDASPEYLKIKTLGDGWVDFTNGNTTTTKILRPQTKREAGQP
jgi:hypothetical protein